MISLLSFGLDRTFGTARSKVLPKPVGQFFFGQLASSQREDGNDQFGIAHLKRVAVQNQKRFADDRGCPLVAVDEGVVAGDPESVSGSEYRSIGIAVGNEIHGTSHGAFQRSSIAYAFTSTMFGELLGMGRQGHIEDDPNPASGHAISRVRVGRACGAP